MPSPKTPVGSTADLPPEDAIAAGEESVQQDIDEMFGMGSDDEVAAGEGEATAPDAAAGAAGAAPEDGPAAAPALPDTPPSGDVAATPPATPTGGTPTAPPAQQPPQSGQPPAPAATPPGIAPADAERLRMASLEATVAALQAELANARANPPQGGAPQAQPQPGQQPDDLPRYALTLPQQVAAALTSGDDQQTVAGITHMMNSLATIVHHNVRLEMRQQFGQLLSTARQQEAEASDAKFIQDSRADYYKAFPDHNSPLILPLIQAESVAMAGEFPGVPWNDDYRNALGQRVNARLAQLRGAAAPQGQQPPAAPAAMLPAGSRPADQSGGELTGGELIADTFS